MVEPKHATVKAAWSGKVCAYACVPLLVGAILLRGRRPVTAILWAMRDWVAGHMTSYHRVLSRASWLLEPLGKLLVTAIIAVAEEHGSGGWILVAGAVIGWFTCRWSIETTFQQMRAHLGFETTRGWARKTVVRAGPCLLGLFCVVSLIYYEHLKCRKPELGYRPGYLKAETTFSDAIAAMRRLFWEETFFARPHARAAVQKLPRKLRQLVFDQLCQAT